MRAAPRVAWYDSPWRIAVRAIAIAVATVLIMAAAALFIVPRALGGTSLTILSGSMEPALYPGDVIAVRGVAEADVCTRVGINDIVTFFPEPGSTDLITHRVVAKTIGSYPDGTACRLVVQGDNNTAVDAPISPAQVRGIFMYGVPAVGWARDWAAQNPMVMFGAFLAIGVAVYGWQAIRGPKTRVVNVPTSQVPTGAIPVAPPAGLPLVAAPSVASPTTAMPSTQPGSATPAAMDPNEFALRMRELDLREREIAIREAETKARLGGLENGSSAPEPKLLLVP